MRARNIYFPCKSLPVIEKDIKLAKINISYFTCRFLCKQIIIVAGKIGDTRVTMIEWPNNVLVFLK